MPAFLVSSYFRSKRSLPKLTSQKYLAMSGSKETKQGFELQMATNVLGHFKLAAILFDLCRLSSSCRIIVVSSGAHNTISKINPEKDFYPNSSWKAYGKSKLGNLLFVAKLNRLLKENGISNVFAVGCHPGFSATGILKQYRSLGPIILIMGQSAEKGAQSTVYAATYANIQADDYCGPRIFEVWGKPKSSCHVNKAVYNIKLQDDFWCKCEELTNVNFTSIISSKD